MLAPTVKKGDKRRSGLNEHVFGVTTASKAPQEAFKVVSWFGSKELNVHGIRGATRNDQRVVAELLEKGRIRMPIHAVLPLAKVAEAHAMLEHSDDVVGRIVLHPWDDV